MMLIPTVSISVAHSDTLNFYLFYRQSLSSAMNFISTSFPGISSPWVKEPETFNCYCCTGGEEGEATLSAGLAATGFSSVVFFFLGILMSLKEWLRWKRLKST